MAHSDNEKSTPRPSNVGEDIHRTYSGTTDATAADPQHNANATTKSKRVGGVNTGKPTQQQVETAGELTEEERQQLASDNPDGESHVLL